MLIDILKTRVKQGHRTMAYPDGPAPELPARFAGTPETAPKRCEGCEGHCLAACPTGAILRDGDGPVSIDMGRCLFCGRCERACPEGAIRFTREFRLAAARREDLIVSGPVTPPEALNRDAAARYGRMFSLRVVSAGGCGACEADTNVLGTLAWDLSRFGIQYAASPRHADGLLLTGPVSRNMASALRETLEAIPEPRFVIAVGTCAISGGMFAENPECHTGGPDLLPVDLFIPGCPPHPLTILDGFLRFLDKMHGKR